MDDEGIEHQNVLHLVEAPGHTFHQRFRDIHRSEKRQGRIDSTGRSSKGGDGRGSRLTALTSSSMGTAEDGGGGGGRWEGLGSRGVTGVGGLGSMGDKG